eukprot:scaffold5118_cov118-Isochrysis_galbana.AAC.4
MLCLKHGMHSGNEGEWRPAGMAAGERCSARRAHAMQSGHPRFRSAHQPFNEACAAEEVTALRLHSPGIASQTFVADGAAFDLSCHDRLGSARENHRQHCGRFLRAGRRPRRFT